MSEPIVPLDAIAKDADLAAQRAAASKVEQPNPYADGSDAAAEWKRRYHIALLRHSALEDTEGSA